MLERDLDVLCKDIGVRTLGSAEEKEAASYICNRMRDSGLDAAIQTFPVERRKFSKVELKKFNASGSKKIDCLPFYLTAFTPEKGLTLQLEYLENISKEATARKNLRGKAVLLYEGLGEDYREYKRLLKSGVSALILIDKRYPVNWPIALSMPYFWLEEGTLPVVCIPYFEAEKLIREKVRKIFIKIGGKTEKSESENVVGVITGKKKTNLVITAHHDSVIVGKGADDNASGVVCILELARTLSLFKPELGIVFVSFGSEEVLSYGAFQFVRMNKQVVDKTKLVVNFDNIGSVFGETKVRVTGSNSLEEYIRKKLQKAPCYFKVQKEVFPYSDQFAFNVRRIPSVFINRVNCTGGHYQYHSFHDDLDHLDIELIGQTADSFLPIIKELANSTKFPFSLSMPPSQQKQAEEYHKNLCKKWLR